MDSLRIKCITIHYKWLLKKIQSIFAKIKTYVSKFIYSFYRKPGKSKKNYIVVLCIKVFNWKNIQL